MQNKEGETWKGLRSWKKMRVGETRNMFEEWGGSKLSGVGEREREKKRKSERETEMEREREREKKKKKRERGRERGERE